MTGTQFLGFPNYGDEYKVMGLAPYGKISSENLLEAPITLVGRTALSVLINTMLSTLFDLADFATLYVPITLL